MAQCGHSAATRALTVAVTRAVEAATAAVAVEVETSGLHLKPLVCSHKRLTGINTVTSKSVPAERGERLPRAVSEVVAPGFAADTPAAGGCSVYWAAAGPQSLSAVPRFGVWHSSNASSPDWDDLQD